MNKYKICLGLVILLTQLDYAIDQMFCSERDDEEDVWNELYWMWHDILYQPIRNRLVSIVYHGIF